jgi:hypothetical protein
MLKDLGLPKFEGVHEKEMYHSTFSALLETAEGRTAITKYQAGAAQKKHNRELHRARTRCAEEYGTECCRCPRGYDSCEFAVRSASISR